MHRRKFGHSHKGRIAGHETLDYQPGLWYGPITVGTPEQTFTGNPSFWVVQPSY